MQYLWIYIIAGVAVLALVLAGIIFWKVRKNVATVPMYRMTQRRMFSTASIRKAVSFLCSLVAGITVNFIR